MALFRPSGELDRSHWPADATWYPTPDIVRSSNLYWLMQQVGVDDYRDLHRWSVEHRADFWRTAVQRLGIRFQKPWDAVLDLSGGVERAGWLVGAAWNVAESCFAADPQSPAVVQHGEDGSSKSLSVAQLERLSNRVARSLQRWGIGPGDAVALILPMTANAVALYLGLLKCGAAAVGIAESFTAEEIAVRLRLSGAKRVFTQDVLRRGGKQHELYARLESIDAPATTVLPAGSQLACPLRDGDRLWDDFLVDDDAPTAVARNADDLVGILFSSGTTGDPKAIPWTNLCPLKCAIDAHFHQDVRPADVVAWPTSMGWMMGPWLIFASLVNRATLALYDGAPTGRGFVKFVERAGVTMLGVVPSLVAAWRAHDCLHAVDWSGIRTFSSTGECSNPDDMRWLMEQAGGRPMIEYCGGTELAGGYIAGTVLQPAVPSAFTTPTLGTDIVLLDDEGQPVEQGEAYLVAPAIGMSQRLLNRDHHDVYFADCPRQQDGTPLRRHGDELQRLPHGYWRAHGRVDDTMNLGGIKVSSAEIERAVHDVAPLRELAAVAEPPPQGGPSRLVIYAVAAEPLDEEAVRQAMQQAIRDRLNPLFKIDRVAFVDALPRTASNKIIRRLLR